MIQLLDKHYLGSGMMRNKKNITLLNTFSNIVLEVVTLANGFIIPKLILNFFGSDVNGLVSSITQFLGCIYLVEGGITGVIMASMYKPLIKKDNAKISSIIKTSERFYRRISLFFICYTIILATFYPLMNVTAFSFEYVFSLVLIMSVGLLVQYAFSITYRTLLNADKKIYVVSFTQSIVLLLNIILCYVSLHIYPEIHILKLISGLVFLVQPIVFRSVVKKNYKLDDRATVDNSLVKNRWSGFAINLAAFIHFNTDIVILNIFATLKDVSVYSIYNLVVSGLRQVVSAISSAIYPVIGHAYARGDNDEINQKFDVYELLNFIIVYMLFTVAIMLTTPFIMIYTADVTDANYNVPILGYILLVAEMIYLIKSPHINLAYSANMFKQMTRPSVIEMIINIVLSVILVGPFGMVGVAIGTLVAMLYRTIYQIYFLKRYVIFRNVWKFVHKVVLFTIGFFLVLLICNSIFPIISGANIWGWIVHGIVYLFIAGVVYLGIAVIFYQKDFKNIIGKIKHV